MFTEDSRDKPENDGGWRRWLSICCESVKYPSPADKSATSPARGEVKNNILNKGLDVVRQYAALLERGVQSSTRVRKVLVETRQANPLGRSMIEMLGVLAIIAVLSVGGLNGFSKAMRIYRSAVQKETLEQILANMVKIRNNLNHKTTTWDNISYVFAAMGELPDGVTLKDNRLYDKSGNSFTVYFGKNTWKTPNGTA